MSDASRANNAQLLLDNSLFGEVVQELREEIFEQWKASSDIKTREEIFAQAAALDTIHIRFLTILENYLSDNPKGSNT